MMREILFRGKRIDNGEWVEGNLWYDPDVDRAEISWFEYYSGDNGLERDNNTCTVDPSTVGQFTGLTDKNGKRIFEGDILKVKSRWKAEWNDEGGCEKKTTYWSVEHKNYSTEMGFFTFGIDRRWHKPLTWSRLYNAEAEVIGNIHDNKELLNDNKV